MIDFELILREKIPTFFEKYPKFISNLVVKIVKKLFYQDEINDFLQNHSALKNVKFIDATLKYFKFTYKIDNASLENIPQSGRVIFIANHPLGALDALSLLNLIGKIRSDVKIIANEFLMEIKPLNQMFIPVDNISNHSSKSTLSAIDEHLKNEGAIIIFPAGEVSRARGLAIKDVKWKSGFLRFAKKSQAPIVPIFIRGRNSPLFYAVSMIYKPLAGLLLGHELFNKQNRSISIKIGEMIPYQNLIMPEITSENNTLKLIQKHLYNIGKGKKAIFKTQQCLIKKINPNDVNDEVLTGLKLGKTRDNKAIFLCQTKPNSPLLLEIGRLRELTFRRVGEGTGKSCDIDEFDLYYKHLVLFDEVEKEIVGAYRLGESSAIKPTYDTQKLYTQTLFEFDKNAKPLFENSIELGRSFVQPKFWGTRALDYLWYGIGAYVRKFPQTRYLFGPVSISGAYPKTAHDMMVFFYKKYFSAPQIMVTSKHRYFIGHNEFKELNELFVGQNYEEDFKILKESLGHYNLSVPTLYKQYSELCDDNGVLFLDFGTDVDFENCTDGFILVDITKIKEAKRKRYIQSED
ncbi:lysophospholipid acyltransferase family protein [Campylobacter geochelonis]|uniref:lysophospholipid acyltransferase family protein n=1 Tax=Campylobacter geochelonis TaxID=1780362 RepID=UPI0007708331|nr:lysophospholipid acyltransferase family protein [Campylobacter geochelonis]CZE46237.1 2-acyl-glycerophospho-ethanolamine acyltransferase [Campylobacter geochelonis]